MVVLDLLVVPTALTTIRRHLHARLGQLEWTINACTLSFAVLLPAGQPVDAGHLGVGQGEAQQVEVGRDPLRSL